MPWSETQLTKITLYVSILILTVFMQITLHKVNKQNNEKLKGYQLRTQRGRKTYASWNYLIGKKKL